MAAADDSLALRMWLRQHTAASHQALDAATNTGSLSDPCHYAAFLHRQYRARLPIERWVQQHCTAAEAPPSMTPAIADDLRVLGQPVPQVTARFALASGADPLGLCWAIAGSHLGNRMMLKELRQGGGALPVSFLADTAMADFWRALRPQLDAPVSAARAQAATLAAEAVFDHFLRAFSAAPRVAA